MMRSTGFIVIITCTLGSHHGVMSRSLVWEVVVFEVLFFRTFLAQAEPWENRPGGGSGSRSPPPRLLS